MKKMNNKSNGTAFERAIAEILADNGFWVHRMQDNKNGQPFDIMAARNQKTYVADCKVCQGDVFVLSRVEENQKNAMQLWEDTGNLPGMFIIRFGSGNTFTILYLVIKQLIDQGLKQLVEQDIHDYSLTLSDWLSVLR